MKYSIILIISSIIIPFLAFGQSLPVTLTFDEENHRLMTESKNSGSFYNEETLMSVYLDFSQPDFWQQLHNCHDTDNYVKGTLTYNGKVYENIGARFKGQTSYSKIKEEEKLSFAVSIDEYVDGQDIEGYNNFNFNNCFQDPTFMREVLYNRLNRYNIPAAKSNFIKLYINGEYWGIYDNVQQLNKDFTKEWFLTNNGSLWRADAPKEEVTTKSLQERPPNGGGGGPNWGDGTAALNYLGDSILKYQQYYTLKSTEQENPWELLLNLTKVLNNTPEEELLDSLSNYLNIDRTLWHLAHETIFSDDDSYIHKGKMDYYIYFEPETNQFVPLEFDGNSALKKSNASWDVFYNENNENYPLMNRLYAIPEIRQRYLAHVRTIIKELLNDSLTETLIDNYDKLISDAVEEDPKKLTSYNQYKFGINTLKDFFPERKRILELNTEVSQVGLTIESVVHAVENVHFVNPGEDEPVNVTAAIARDKNVNQINLFYSLGLVGNFTKMEMFDDGVHNDGEAGDAVYGASIPGFSSGQYVRYYIEAVANDEAKTVSYSPEGAEHDVYYYRVDVANTIASDVVINEFVASNSTVVADNEGEYDDWIEFYNNANTSISLNGYYLSDDSQDLRKWKMPEVSIEAKSYLVIWADNNEEQGENHTNFKLSADGEELFLITPNGEIADQLTYGGQGTDFSYGRYPNGTGAFQILVPTFNSENNLNITSIAQELLVDKSPIKVYPNPFNTSTTVEFKLEKESEVKLSVFNSMGQEVNVLVNENLPAGDFKYIWNSTSNSDNPLKNGLYLTRLLVSNSDGVTSKSEQIIKIN